MIPDVYSNPQGGAASPSSTPLAPAFNPYNQDQINENVANSVGQGQGILGASKGALLTQNTLTIPFEVYAGNIANYGKLPARPVLLKLGLTFNVDVERPEGEDPSLALYQKLRAKLPQNLQAKLTYDEQQDPHDRDPDLVAVDLQLHFVANYLTALSQVATPTQLQMASIQAGQQKWQELGDSLSSNVGSISQEVEQHMQGYLATIGKNNPAYDILTNSLGLIQDAIKAGLGISNPKVIEE